MLLLILEPQRHEFVVVLFIQSLLCMQLASKNYNKKFKENLSQMGVKLKLILKNKQKIKPLSSTTLVTTCHIAQPIDDYCLLVQPNDLINNLFVAKEMFVFSRFTGRISIPIQNVKDNQITLEAGTDIGDIHFIPFGIK